MPETLVLLHGFGGTHRAWDPVLPELDHERYSPIVPDLRGHGTKSAVRPVSFEGCVGDVLAAAPDDFVLCGYSFGGRVAQQVALAAPARIRRLVLVSTSAGIDDPRAREARIAEDERLADDLEHMTIAEYADRWMAQPLFAGTPPASARWWREDLLRNDPVGLAAALRGIGGGQMEPFWDRLGELTMPVTVVVGSRDEKFVAFAEQYRARLPHAEVHVIEGAGHGLPREAPAELAALIQGAA
ncbi:MAG TPA: alpha/beta fold hydrolase [Baekduia sp.]|nr:alpha/beta fold hydrolase [Baekduia sp.]